jgi:hypothetical protein
MNFELCSVSTVGEDYVYEIPPAPTNHFNMLYRNDKLGHSNQTQDSSFTSNKEHYKTLILTIKIKLLIKFLISVQLKVSIIPIHGFIK